MLPKKWLALCLIALNFEAFALAKQPQPSVLKLSLKKSIKMALSSNLGLKIESLNPQISEQDLRRNWAKYGLTAGTNLNLTQNISPSSNSFISGGSILNQNRQSYNFNLRQPLPTGGDLRLQFDNQINHTNSTRADFNPALTPQLSFSLKQPLMRQAFNGLRELSIQNKQTQQSYLSLESQVLETIARTQTLYWGLVKASERLKVQKQALKTLNDLLKMNQAKEKAGFLSKIDVQQTEARIALRQAQLLETQRQKENTEDRLRQLLNPAAYTTWNWDTPLLPSDTPQFKPIKLSLDTSLQYAFTHRPDWGRMNLNTQAAELQVNIAGQNLLPQLDLDSQAGLESLSDTYPSALGQLFQFQTYFWKVGLKLDMPVIQNQYWDLFKQAQLRQDKVKLQAQQLKQNIYQKMRQAVRNVRFNAQRVKAFSLARTLAEEQLKAQTEKLNLGLSTNFQVLQFQNDFESASLSEVNATVDYILSVAQLNLEEGRLKALFQQNPGQHP